jgi:hypothetical protein
VLAEIGPTRPSAAELGWRPSVAFGHQAILSDIRQLWWFRQEGIHDCGLSILRLAWTTIHHLTRRHRFTYASSAPEGISGELVMPRKQEPPREESKGAKILELVGRRRGDSRRDMRATE